MKRFALALILAIMLIVQTSNPFWVATWIWVSYPGQIPSGEWVLINLQPNTGI